MEMNQAKISTLHCFLSPFNQDWRSSPGGRASADGPSWSFYSHSKHLPGALAASMWYSEILGRMKNLIMQNSNIGQFALSKGSFWTRKAINLSSRGRGMGKWEGQKGRGSNIIIF